jgi:hypothetical protein
MLKRWITYAAACLLLTGPLLGCGSDKDKNINTHKDKPKAADKAD